MENSNKIINKKINKNLLRARYQNKRYLLKGYTTPSKVKEHIRRDKHSNVFSQVFSIVAIIVIILLIIWYTRPFQMIMEFSKMIGFD